MAGRRPLARGAPKIVARRPSSEPDARTGARMSRVLLRGFGLLVLAILLVAVAVRVEAFLIEDPRFLLAPPTALGAHTSSFYVTGLFYTSEAQVQEIFARDFGRSIYLCPIAERRRRLLGIDWVDDATVSRIWPNRIEVHIRERKPVAFVQIAGAGGSMLPRLIDADGVILDPLRRVRLKLPVLAGVRASDSPEMRRARVERLLIFQGDVGPLMDKISEVEISDLENIRVTQAVDGRILTLLVGNHDFRQRLQNLLANYAEINNRMPNATVLDLRVPGRITAAAEPNASPTRNGGLRGKS
jgi:cell division protein FtsQ